MCYGLWRSRAGLAIFRTSYSDGLQEQPSCALNSNHTITFVLQLLLRYTETNPVSETGRYGSLEIRQVSYNTLPYSVVKSFEFDTATITISHVADMILLYKLDDFEMLTVRYGYFKGCRHWWYALLSLNYNDIVEVLLIQIAKN